VLLLLIPYFSSLDSPPCRLGSPKPFLAPIFPLLVEGRNHPPFKAPHPSRFPFFSLPPHQHLSFSRSLDRGGSREKAFFLLPFFRLLRRPPSFFLPPRKSGVFFLRCRRELHRDNPSFFFNPRSLFLSAGKVPLCRGGSCRTSPLHPSFYMALRRSPPSSPFPLAVHPPPRPSSPDAHTPSD